MTTSNDKVVITHTETGKTAEQTITVVVAHTLTLEVASGWEGGTIKATVDDSPVISGGKVADGKTVTITITPESGKMLYGLRKNDGSVSEVTNQVINNEYTFKITKNVTIEALFQSKTLDIGGGVRNLDALSISGLSWDDANSTLIMENYSGGAIKAGNQNDITIKVVGTNNTITGENNFYAFTNLLITGETGAKLTIEGTASSTTGINAFSSSSVEVEDVDLVINLNNSNSGSDTDTDGIYGSITVSGTGNLEINVDNPSSSNNTAKVAGVTGTLTLKETATAKITVKQNHAESTGTVTGVGTLDLQGTGTCEITVTNANTKNSPGTTQAIGTEFTLPSGYSKTGDWDTDYVKYYQ